MFAVCLVSAQSMFVLCVMCFFFFFKQKTAYEMRISDWSSDVCSSDLIGEGLDIALRVRFPPLENSDLVMRVLRESPQRLVASPALLNKIGRASCRERVCQYV